MVGSQSACGGSQKRKPADTPTRPAGKRGRTSNPTVLLVGFNEREKNELRSKPPPNLKFAENLNLDVTHVVLKPPVSSSSKSLHCSPLYFAVLSGAWILRQKWLEESRKKNEIADESKFTLKSTDIDINLSTKTGRISVKEILTLQEQYSEKMTGSSLFAHDLYQRVLILSKKTADSRQKKNELRSVLEAGGANMVGDDLFRQLREKPHKFADQVSVVLIINGEPLEEIGIDNDFVRKLLNLRVPVLYEQFVTKSIRNQLEPSEYVLMIHSYDTWLRDLSLKEGSFSWIVEGKGEPENLDDSCRSQCTPRPSRQSPKAHKPVEIEVDDDHDGVTLGDFEKEVTERAQPVQPRVSITPQKQVVDENEISMVLAAPDWDQTAALLPVSLEDDFGLGAIDLGADGVLDFIEPRAQSSWSDVRIELQAPIKTAIGKAGFDNSEQMADSRAFFQQETSQLKNHQPTTQVHDMLCCNAVNFIRHSTHSRFLPTSNVLSLLLHNIAMPEYGSQFDCSNAIYRLISSFLHQFPPTNSGGRYYWLKVFSTVVMPTGRKLSFSPEVELEMRVKAFRTKIVDSFSGTGTSANLMDILLQLLELDLFALQGCGGLDDSQEVAPLADESDESRRLSLTARPVNNDGSDVEGIPLAYLVLYDHTETRKRGLDSQAMKRCLDVADYMTKHNGDAFIVNRCARLLCVCLEALRWYLSEVTRMFRGTNLSYDLKVDLEHLLRHFIKNGWTKDEIKGLFPVAFIASLIQPLR